MNMNQPQVHICLLPPEPPSHLPHHPPPVGFHRVPGWVPCDIQQIPTSYLFYIYMCVCMSMHVQSCPTLCDPVVVACQAPLSMGFSRQESWSGLPFPSPGDLPDPGIEPMVSCVSCISKWVLHQLSHQGSPYFTYGNILWVGDWQGGLAGCNSWGRKESDMTERLNWTEYIC